MRRGGIAPVKKREARVAPAAGPAGASAFGSIDLAAALELEGIDQEVAMLRTLIHDEYRRGEGRDTAELRRLVLALCGALRLQQALAERGDRDDQRASQILDAIAMELDVHAS
ncbi:MAG: hypothetical protein IT307_06735 [Chloroflexi bacterium]|nr:hypothetical protein [Chloroflexota bacterium]